MKNTNVKKMFHVGITAGLHELLRTNYCLNPNYCAGNAVILF